MDIYALRSEMRQMQLVRRTSSEPNYETGKYTNTYSTDDLLAVSMPVALIIREGVQRRPFEHGAYYDQQRRQFFVDLSLNTLTAEPLPREWIVDEGQRYEIESVETVGTGVLRITGRQETEVTPTNIFTENVRSKVFLEQEVSDS
jgi:hypothetical protein